MGGADPGVEHRGVVQVLFVVVLGRRVAAALLREHVDDDRLLEFLCVAERLFELREIVPVDGPDVADPEALEERRRLGVLADRRLHRLHPPLGLAPDEGKVAQQVLELALPPHVDRVHPDPRHAVRQVGDRRRVRAAVVVQHDDDPPAGMAEVVERLVRQASGHRTVADHRHDVPAGLGDTGVARRCQPVGVGEHRRRMRVLDQVVPALLTARVPRQTARLAQVFEPGEAAGDELVHVGLVPGVPQHRVGRRLEHAVQRQRELDRAEVGSQVAAVGSDGLHDHVTDLPGELAQFDQVQAPQVSGFMDAAEQVHRGPRRGLGGRPKRYRRVTKRPHRTAGPVAGRRLPSPA